MKPILGILGPTAVGKSKLALNLAQQINTEIISADSMQIYKKFDIGTAKASLQERTLVKHHLIDIAEPYENFNTASILEDMVYMYCQSFAYGRPDVTIPDPITRLKERYDDLKDLITDLRVDISYLQGLCDDYERILKEHGLL